MIYNLWFDTGRGFVFPISILVAWKMHRHTVWKLFTSADHFDIIDNTKYSPTNSFTFRKHLTDNTGFETLSTTVCFRLYIGSVRNYRGSFSWLNSKRTKCTRSLWPTLWRSQPILTKGSCWSTTAADEPEGIAGITLIQSTFQKEEPVMTGAVVRIAGDIPVTSASDAPFSQLYRSLLLFIEFLIVNQNRQPRVYQVKQTKLIKYC
jgi:hypothetical protein